MRLSGETPGGEPIAVQIARGRIESVSHGPPIRGGVREGGERTCLGPGLIDIQVNGFAGVDFNRPDLEPGQVEGACAAMLATGVTGFFPTLITNTYPRLGRAVGKILEARRMSRLAGAMIKGVHLEGPHINPQDGPRGAHPLAHVSPPDWEEFQRLQAASRGLIRLVTLAPELPGALDFIGRAAAKGVVAALGHCAPEAGVVDQAVARGARLSTHLGNGAHELLHRHANYIQAQLAKDELMASIICDGHHLPDYFVQNLVRAKGPARIILITDATGAAGSPPGRYTMGELEVVAGEDGVLRLPGTPYLAGSTLTMDRAVANCARAAGIDLALAVDMATVNPARLFPEAGGVLREGGPADLIRYRVHQGGIQVLEAFPAGRAVELSRGA